MKKLTYRDLRIEWKKQNFKSYVDIINFCDDFKRKNVTNGTKKRIDKLLKKFNEYRKRNKKGNTYGIKKHPTNILKEDLIKNQLETLFRFYQNDDIEINVNSEPSDYKKEYLGSYSCGGYTFYEHLHKFNFNSKFLYELNKIYNQIYTKYENRVDIIDKKNKYIPRLVFDRCIIIDIEKLERKIYKVKLLKPVYRTCNGIRKIKEFDTTTKLLFWDTKNFILSNAKTLGRAKGYFRKKRIERIRTRAIKKFKLDKDKLDGIIITEQDVKKVGACNFGIKTFKEKYNITTNKISASELYSLEPENKFIKDAIKLKIFEKDLVSSN